MGERVWSNLIISYPFCIMNDSKPLASIIGVTRHALIWHIKAVFLLTIFNDLLN
jgi:hypothetical protein